MVMATLLGWHARKRSLWLVDTDPQDPLPLDLLGMGAKEKLANRLRVTDDAKLNVMYLLLELT
jgi:hypothetical protein